MFNSKKIAKRSTALERDLSTQLQAARETISRQCAAMETLRNRARLRANPWIFATVNTVIHPLIWPRASVNLTGGNILSVTLTDKGPSLQKSKPAAVRTVPQVSKPVASAPEAQKPVVILPAPGPASASPMDAAAMRLFKAPRFETLTKAQQKIVRKAVLNGHAQ